MRSKKVGRVVVLVQNSGGPNTSVAVIGIVVCVGGGGDIGVRIGIGIVVVVSPQEERRELVVQIRNGTEKKTVRGCRRDGSIVVDRDGTVLVLVISV